MSTNVVSDFLIHRSADEKKTLLVELLRELMQQSPRQPISIQDQSGRTVGLFSPLETSSEGDFFDEGSPAFFRELERRQNDPDGYISVEEFFRYLHGAGDGK
jgi:hypothetical protein